MGNHKLTLENWDEFFKGINKCDHFKQLHLPACGLGNDAIKLFIDNISPKLKANLTHFNIMANYNIEKETWSELF